MRDPQVRDSEAIAWGGKLVVLRVGERWSSTQARISARADRASPAGFAMSPNHDVATRFSVRLTPRRGPSSGSWTAGPPAIARFWLPDDRGGSAIDPSFHRHDQVPHIGQGVVNYDLGNGSLASPSSP